MAAWDLHRIHAESLIPILDHRKLGDLTEIELVVLELYGRGLEPKEISTTMRRSLQWSYYVLDRIRLKLGVASFRRSILVRWAVECGLVKPLPMPVELPPAWMQRLPAIGAEERTKGRPGTQPQGKTTTREYARRARRGTT